MGRNPIISGTGMAVLAGLGLSILSFLSNWGTFEKIGGISIGVIIFLIGVVLSKG